MGVLARLRNTCTQWPVVYQDITLASKWRYKGGHQQVQRCPHSVAGSRLQNPGLGRFRRLSPAAPPTHAAARYSREAVASEGRKGCRSPQGQAVSHGPQRSPGPTRGFRRSAHFSAARPDGLALRRFVPARWAGVLELAPPEPGSQATTIFGVLATPP
ncbi:hypothetical protein NDU88_004278 [Pleurodeles waltl]|uniref:Uncharacterized protein n=1 Tax=Pleurodeles waltl TaxID=8319 RepID=A0AAV7QEZ7_PLEWA|nr:hypothetical protein NDU88_004278 [Pleurodeles waltl]